MCVGKLSDRMDREYVIYEYMVIIGLKMRWLGTQYKKRVLRFML